MMYYSSLGLLTLEPMRDIEGFYSVEVLKFTLEAHKIKMNRINDRTLIGLTRETERGWSGDAMVLGKLPVPGRPTILITVGQGPIALAVGAGGGCLDIFTLIYPFFPLSPSLWETARYRLKYCLKGPLNPKPTNEKRTTCDFVFAKIVRKRAFLLYASTIMNTGSSYPSRVPLLTERQPEDKSNTNHDRAAWRIDPKLSGISSWRIFPIEE